MDATDETGSRGNPAGTDGDQSDGRSHLVVLIDRSGSMADIADDVIGGFNRWLADQQASGDDAVVTLVLFDSINSHEVVADAVPVAEVIPLDERTFRPRGSTPLLDATEQVISRAREREKRRAHLGLPAEAVVIVSITDGHENASRRITVDRLRRKIAKRERRGWTFVFLSAALDVYGEARSLGYRDGNVQAFAADAPGTYAAFHSLSQATGNVRRMLRTGTFDPAGSVWGEDKPAESDRDGRS